MKIIGVKSICCGKSVKTAPPTKRRGDQFYICLGCEKLCDHFYIAEIERKEK